MRRYVRLALITVAVATPALTFAQTTHESARLYNRAGWEEMRAERFAEAAKSFQAAIDIERVFELPYYGLGRANLAMKRYVEAIRALETCRELYEGQGAKVFATTKDAQRRREDQLVDLDEQIRIVMAASPNARQQDLVRQLQNHKRLIQEDIARNTNLPLGLVTKAPAWVLLSLGSAYFRAGRLVDAEREYKATIAVDAKAGEAHNNLAVLYLETDRPAEAAASLRDAKRAGFNVHPELERAVRAKSR